MEEYSLWGIIILVVQVYCAFHAFRRQRIIWALLNFFFIFSAIFYLFMYVFPERRGGGSGMGMTRGGSFKPNIQMPKQASNIFISPQKKLDELKSNLEQSDTVENRRKLADQYFSMAKYREALEWYERCLTGIFKDDPAILTDAAKTSYLVDDFQKALEYIELIEQTKPNYADKSHLLVKARILQKNGDYSKAITLLEQNMPYFKGEEGKYRLAELFIQTGDIDKGLMQAREVVDVLNMASKTYQEEQAIWREEADKLINTHSSKK
jgi:hypothetical protein